MAAEGRDDERKLALKLSKRHADNYESKRNAMLEADANTADSALSIYDMELNPHIPKKPRSEVTIGDLLIAKSPLPGPGLDVVKQLGSVLLNKPSAPLPAPANAQQQSTASKTAQALRLVAPRNTPMQPIGKFVEQNLPVLALAAKKQQQQITIQGQTVQALSPATAAAPVPSGRPRSLSVGSRASVLHSGTKSSGIGGGDLPLPALPNIDPAKRTMDAMDLMTALNCKYMQHACNYMYAKSHFDDRVLPSVIKLAPDYVDVCHLEATSPFHPCTNGELCAGKEVSRNHEGGRFPYVQYVPYPVRVYFEQTGRLPTPHEEADNSTYMPLDDSGQRPVPGLCLECLNKQLVMLFHSNIGNEHPAQKLYPPFTYSVGVLGGYVEAAMVSSSSSRTYGLTTPLRKFGADQFEPCMREVLALEVDITGQRRLIKKLARGHREKDCVKYLSETQCKQSRMLEARPSAIGVSSVPSKMGQRDVNPLQPAVYPVTRFVGIPHSAEQVLHKQFLNDKLLPIESGPVKHESGLPAPKDPLRPAAVVKEEPMEDESSQVQASSTPDWTKMMDVARQFSAKCQETKRKEEEERQKERDETAALSKKVQARRALEPPRAECGDAHHIDGKMVKLTLWPERVPLGSLPEPRLEREYNRLDLTFRDLGDAFRLLRVWLQRGYSAFRLGFMDKYEHLQLIPAGTSLCDAYLLQHLIQLRLNVCLDIEEFVFGQVGSRRPWIYARALPPPGTAANNGHHSAAAAAAAQATATASRNRRRLNTENNILHQISMEMLDRMNPTDREQTGTQVVFWRDRHCQILDKLWPPVSVGRVDPPCLMGSAPLPTDPTTLGQEPWPFEQMFHDWTDPLGRIYDKDLSGTLSETKLHCHETPCSYLRERVASSSDSKLLLETVLVDFRSTIDYLSCHSQAQVRFPEKQHWFPCSDEFCNELGKDYFLHGGHAQEREAWVKKTCDHISRKDSVGFEGSRRARDLREASEQRTASVQVGFQSELSSAQESMHGLRSRHETLRQLYREGRLWHPRPLGQDSVHNRLILSAVFYRVNHGTEQLLRERRRLDILEQNLKQLVASRPMEEQEQQQAAEEDEEEEDDEDGVDQTNAPRTSQQDDLDQIRLFMKMFERSMAKMAKVRKAGQARSPEEQEMRQSIQDSLDCMHRWKRFVYSHLPLAQLCTDTPECTDKWLLAEDLSNGRLSQYTMLYPYSELGWGEEMLQSIRQRAHMVDVVYSANVHTNTSTVGSGVNGSGTPAKPHASILASRRDDADEMLDKSGSAAHSNPWVALLKKIIPKACSDRDFSSKCDELCRAHPRIFHYVLECFLATLAGLYNHCRNPASFEQAIQLYRVMELAREHIKGVAVQIDEGGPTTHIYIQPYQEALLDILFANEELVINSLRENVLCQLGDDSMLCMIDSNWVIACTHLVRTMYQTNGNLKQVQQILLQHYSNHGLLAGTKQLPTSMAMAVGEAPPVVLPGGGNGSNSNASNNNSNANNNSNKASVYRVSKKNFGNYIDGCLRSIGTETTLLSIIASMSAGLSSPCVYHLSPDAFDLILRVVESTRPGEPIQVRWFELIGVSDAGVALLLSAYDMFRRRAHENEIKRQIRSLSPLDFELLSIFFHLLKAHSDQRLIPLDTRTAQEQELTARHRAGIKSLTQPIPVHQISAAICSIVGCNELKNYVVQRTHAPLFCGFPKTAWNQHRLCYVCTNKKTVLVRERNADRMFSQIMTPGQPEEWLRRLMEEMDTSGFYGCYAPVEELLRLPPGTINTPEFKQAQIYLNMQHSTPTLKRRETTGRRDNLEHSFAPEISKRCKRLEELLRQFGIEPNSHVLYSLEYAPKERLEKLTESQFQQLEGARSQLDAECKKEERRIWALKTRLPCYELPIQYAPICGYVLEKDSQKNKSSSVAATLCRSCGCTFDFSLKLNWANGYGVLYCVYPLTGSV
jgi:protein tyrosine phosphatase (PTP) superfamily phosphohydrolase (DUF442 family)